MVTAMRCALCRRPMLSASMMIGSEPIGPVCARKLGLSKLAKKRGSTVVRVAKPPVRAASLDALTLDLFPEYTGSISEPESTNQDQQGAV